MIGKNYTTKPVNKNRQQGHLAFKLLLPLKQNKGRIETPGLFTDKILDFFFWVKIYALIKDLLIIDKVEVSRGRCTPPVHGAFLKTNLRRYR